YRKDIIKIFQDEENIDSLFDDLTEALQKVEYEKLQKYDWFLKRELNPIVRENKKVFKRRNKRHQLLREIRRVIRAKNKRRRLYRLLYEIGRASCRERMKILDGEETVQRKKRRRQ